MIDVIDGFKAGGCGKIFIRHLLKLIFTLCVSIVLVGLIRFLLEKDEIIPLGAEFIGVLIALVLMHLVDFMRVVIKNGEHSEIPPAT